VCVNLVFIPHPERKRKNKMGSLFCKEEIVSPDMDLIVDNLYFGSSHAAHSKKGLKKAGITHIINLIPNEEPPFPEDFEYKWVMITDNLYKI
jgi:hypothetical protein